MVRPVSAVVAAGVLLVVAACGTHTTGSTPAPSTTVGTQLVEEAVGIPPKPDTATQQAYISDLVAIDPDIVHGEEDKAVSRGRDQCSSVREWPQDQAKLVDLAQRRFIAPGHPEGFGPDKSAQILAAVREHLCPTY